MLSEVRRREGDTSNQYTIWMKVNSATRIFLHLRRQRLWRGMWIIIIVGSAAQVDKLNVGSYI